MIGRHGGCTRVGNRRAIVCSGAENLLGDEAAWEPNKGLVGCWPCRGWKSFSDRSLKISSSAQIYLHGKPTLIFFFFFWLDWRKNFNNFSLALNTTLSSFFIILHHHHHHPSSFLSNNNVLSFYHQAFNNSVHSPVNVLVVQQSITSANLDRTSMVWMGRNHRRRPTHTRSRSSGTNPSSHTSPR